MNKKSRIRNPYRHLSTFKENDSIYICKGITDDDKEIIQSLGFSFPYIIGERLLPSPNISKPLFENAEGKYKIRRDLPKETMYRYHEWTWEDYTGKEYWDSKYIPYERFPREYFLPLALELTIMEGKNSNTYLTAEIIEIKENNLDKIQLAMNMFISLFGEFKVCNDELNEPVNYIKHLPWKILRPGQDTEQEIKQYIEQRLSNYSNTKRNMCKRSIDKLMRSSPKVIAVGLDGFSGYIVFEYPKKHIAILESFLPNNATYVLGKDWEEISKYTKSEVLNNQLHIDRIYHSDNWEGNLNNYIA